MYAEANEGNKGDNASLVSPEFTSGVNSSMEFFYHIYSNSVFDHQPGTLKVTYCCYFSEIVQEKYLVEQDFSIFLEFTNSSSWQWNHYSIFFHMTTKT